MPSFFEIVPPVLEKKIFEGFIPYMRGSRKCSQRGGGGVQIPRRGPTENFNIAKINNLAIPGGGRGGGPDPLSPPLDPPMPYMGMVAILVM